MSVYSGFATRIQEQKYNNLLQTLVIALKKRLIKFYCGQLCDEGKFKLLLKKIYKKMFILQKGKFMPPKFTSCFTDLIQSLSIQINYDTMSECSSMMSQTFSLRKNSIELQTEQLRSNALLSNKKNLLQVKASKIFNSSFSLSKDQFSPRFDTLEEIKAINVPRSTSLDQYQNQLKPFKSIKFKLNQIKNLKDLRGTINMPKVENFLPKKQEIQPNLFNPRRKAFEQQPNKNNQSLHHPTSKVVFRRQKYSRAEVKAEDI